MIKINTSPFGLRLLRAGGLDTQVLSGHHFVVEKVAIKRSLMSEGVPPLIEDPREAMEIFEEILPTSPA